MPTVRVLEVEKISKRFPGVVALDAVSLAVGAGEVVALVGENGAGKSTLMKILAGLHLPDAGEIRIDGRPVTVASSSEAARLGIGVIHQELEVVETLDVAANISLGREPVWGGPLRLLDRRKMQLIAAAALSRLGVTMPVRTPVRALSTAQRQLVTIARALAMDARILILDEPTSSLTVDDTNRLLQVIRDLRAQGVAVIYISHRLAEVEAIADRVVVLRDGRNVGTLERDAITRDVVVRMMVDREIQRHEWSEPCQARPGEPDTVHPMALRVDELRTRRYPDVAVSFAVRRGEILGVAGLIGAGRTEVAEAICGMTRRVGGTISIDDVALAIDSPRAAIAHGIYLVPEDRHRCGLMDAASVRENITLPDLRRHARAGIIRARAERGWAQHAATVFRVKTPSIGTAVSNLSGGNQQKVILARWLSLSPRVVVFDEPTRGIDVGARAEIYDVMRGLAAAGTAIVMVSSDIEEILEVSDRVAVMHDGRVTGILDRGECTPERVMQMAVA
jgi:ribose transport system ATP-binding protein